MSNIIEIENLSLSYNKKDLVLKKLNLTVNSPSIFGFIGVNGSGKSTTIKSMLGLIPYQSGSIKLFGLPIKKNRTTIFSKIGALIENPSLYGHLTGYDNLKIYCHYQKLPLSRIAEIVTLIGLENGINKRCSTYSLGMKQRLGLGIALLNDPDLLILDEPTIGLDPQGRIALRGLLKKLHQQGKTIFVSSHLLSELEQIATEVGILKNGQIIFQGNQGDLIARRTGEKVSIEIEEANLAAPLLLEQGYVIKVIHSKQIEVTIKSKAEIPKIINFLCANNISIFRVQQQQTNLEDLFIQSIN